MTSQERMEQPVSEKVKEQEMTSRLEEVERAEITVGGTTRIDEEVVGSIAGVAAREVEGIVRIGSASFGRSMMERAGMGERRTRGMNIEVGTKEAILDLEIFVKYGFNIPDVIIELRKKVASRLLDLTGLFAKEINVKVAGVEFEEK